MPGSRARRLRVGREPSAEPPSPPAAAVEEPRKAHGDGEKGTDASATSLSTFV